MMRNFTLSSGRPCVVGWVYFCPACREFEPLDEDGRFCVHASRPERRCNGSDTYPPGARVVRAYFSWKLRRGRWDPHRFTERGTTEEWREAEGLLRAVEP